MAQFIDYGNGKEGSLNISAGNLGGVGGFGVATFTGTAGNNSGTFGDAGYFNGSAGGRIGDLCIIHQSQGTGAGNWEIVRIIGRSGSTVTFDRNLVNNYVSGAQIQSAPNLFNGTISGNLTPYSSWAGSTGGIIFIVDKGTLTISGSISANGAGYRGCPRPGVNGSGGVPGRNGGYGESYQQSYGGGNVSDGSATLPVANGGGGSAAQSNPRGLNDASGGGGHATAGGTGQGGSGGAGGGTGGNAELTKMIFGGGSGAVGGFSEGYGANGVNGAGAIIIFAKEIIVNGSLTSNGQDGVNGGGYTGGCGAGAGGSILFVCKKSSLGTNSITAIGGTPSRQGSSDGGTGGVGRIAIHYATSVSGTTSPTYTGVQDTSLSGQIYGLMY